MKNQLIQKFTNKVSLKMGRTGLKIRKYGPEIALATGVAGVIGTVVLACKETLKADEVLDRHNDRLNRLQKAVEIVESGEDEEYDERDVKRDKFVIYCKFGGELLRLYAPAIILGTTSIGLILWSHGIMKGRYLGAVAAYNAVNEAFNTYRERVRNEAGAETDRHYMFGTERDEVTGSVIDENGKRKKKDDYVEVIPNNIKKSEYTRVWGPGETRAFMQNNDNCRAFLIGQQEIANCILNTKGHLFFNEVLDMLGYPQTDIGAITGWVKGANGKDGYVDFGVLDLHRPDIQEWIDNKTKTITLDFNVDGPILGLI